MHPGHWKLYILTEGRFHPDIFVLTIYKKEDILGVRREMTLWEAGHVSTANSSEWKMAAVALPLLKFVL